MPEPSLMDITYDPIGSVSCQLIEPADAPRQGSLESIRGRIDLHEPYRIGIKGYDADDIIVIWHAHLADRTILESDRFSGRGIFTTRSQDRPNPICLTRCHVLEVDEAGLEVEGIDMLDETPVIDLKPPL